MYWEDKLPSYAYFLEGFRPSYVRHSCGPSPSERPVARFAQPSYGPRNTALWTSYRMIDEYQCTHLPGTYEDRKAPCEASPGTRAYVMII